MFAVLLVCDIHAHLVAHEIIGFLAGTWNAQTGGISLWKKPWKIIYCYFFPFFVDLHVEEAFPCNSIVSGPDNVEMDPESEMTVRNAIFEKNLFVVGWYHSHPWFEPHPSRVDLENQSRYQSLFHDDESNKDPFVGLIVGTTNRNNYPFKSNGRYVRSTSSHVRIGDYHVPHTSVDDRPRRAKGPAPVDPV